MRLDAGKDFHVICVDNERFQFGSLPGGYPYVEEVVFGSRGAEKAELDKVEVWQGDRRENNVDNMVDGNIG